MRIERMRVQQWGYLLYWVSSRSRKNHRHLVDLEGQDEFPTICTCEAYIYHGHRPCAHILAATTYALEAINVREEIVEVTLEQMAEYGGDLRLALPRAYAIVHKPFNHETRIANPPRKERAPELPKRRYRLDPGAAYRGRPRV